MLLCLNSKEKFSSALLKSPTGNGKTLALFSSILTWNENRINNNLPAKKIIYCTRTISQINNVINEIKKIKRLYKTTTSFYAQEEKFH